MMYNKYMVELQGFLNNVPDTIENHMIKRTYPKGTSVILQGYSNQSLYFITKGSVEVCMQTHQDVNISLRTHEATDCFGVLEIFDKELKTQSVICKSESTIVVLNKKYVLEWMKLDFEFNLYIINLLSSCFRLVKNVATTLSSLSIKERILLSVYKHNIAGDLETLNKKALIQEIRAPLRSLNRSLAQCITEGYLLFEDEKFQVSNEILLNNLIEPLL